MTFGRRILALCIALCLVLTVCPAAFAEGDPIVAGAFQKGAYASEGTDTVYLYVTGTGSTNLYSVPSAGGSMVLVETATDIKDLIAVGANVYYLRSANGSWQLVRRTGAQATILQIFASGANVSNLGYYDGTLYAIVDEWLFSYNAQTGQEALVSEQMLSEYFILGGRIYYVSTEDKRAYSRVFEATTGNRTLQVTGGCLYSMSLTGGDVRSTLEIGIADLYGYGEYLYFHNYSDNYAVGSSTNDDMWLDGKLYRYNIVTGMHSRSRLNYDWGFYPSQYGLLVYTQQALNMVDLSAVIANPTAADADAVTAASRLLMAPELRTSVTVDGEFSLVYEHTAQSLTKLPLNGEVGAVLAEGLPTGGAIATVETAGQYVDPTIAAASTVAPVAAATQKPAGTTTTKKPASSSSTSASGYLFPESSTRKLTTSDLKKVDPTLWAYGRNEIYAKHGYKFSKNNFADYFAKKTWYKAGGFSTKDLNDIEWYNMSFIKEYEDIYKEDIAAMKAGTFTPSKTAEPAVPATDSSYIFPNSSTTLLTEADVRSIDRSLWGFARNEIFARHGYEFKNSVYAKYFATKTWYKAGGFSTKDLNDIEWSNMNLIKKLEAAK